MSNQRSWPLEGRAVSGMPRILLVGASGFLGCCLLTALQERAHVIPTFHSHSCWPEALPYDFWSDDLSPILERQRVDIVVMAANVPYLVAQSANDAGVYRQRVEHFVRAARGCRLVYVSSDGIFDGKQGLYAEADIPTPSTAYGRNLHIFETCVQANCVDYCIVRPSYLYGYAGTELDQRLTQARAELLAGRAFPALTDMFKSPMEVNQVAAAIVSLALSSYRGIVHVAGPRMSHYDFYCEAMEALGVPYFSLQANTLPADTQLTPDTSLRTELMQRLTGIEALSVREALTGGRL